MNPFRRFTAAWAQAGAAELSPEPPRPPAAGPTVLSEKDAAFLLDDPGLTSLLDQVEARIGDTAAEAVPALLEPVPLDVFALLATHRPPRWPQLAAWLPAMPAEEVQWGMTGASGQTVMLEAAGFVHRLLPTYRALGSTPLERTRILDYGIGWARVARLFYKFTPPGLIHGADAWAESLQMARGCGFAGPLALIDAVPTRLPFEGLFDLVYAFSVFTHLPESSARAAMRAIRDGLAPGGLVVITIRPAQFWRLGGRADAAERLEAHSSEGFSFRPSAMDPVDGVVPYGDASMSLEYIARAWTEFRIVGVEVNGADPYQLMVTLTAA